MIAQLVGGVVWTGHHNALIMRWREVGALNNTI
jgi:hypothetical protein